MVSCVQGVPVWPRMLAASGVSLDPREYLHVASGGPTPSHIAAGCFDLGHCRCHSLRLAPCCSSFTGSFWKKIFGGQGEVGSKNPCSGP